VSFALDPVEEKERDRLPPPVSTHTSGGGGGSSAEHGGMMPEMLPAEMFNLTGSLLLRGRLGLDTAVEEAPKMDVNARKMVLGLADTKMGRSKIKAAVKGFKSYLETKAGLGEVALDEGVGAYQAALSTDLSGSIFGFDSYIAPQTDMFASVVAAVEEEMDLDDLDPNLEAYFVTLSQWIKEVEEGPERVTRANLALEQFTKELVDALREKSEVASRETGARLEGAKARQAELKELEIRHREEMQPRAIEQALSLDLYGGETSYKLRKFNGFLYHTRAQRVQIRDLIAFSDGATGKLFTDLETIATLNDLHKQLIAKADGLLERNMQEDHSGDIEEFVREANAFKLHLENIDRNTKLKYADMFRA